MKLVRFGRQGHEKPGLWLETADGPRVVDVQAKAFDIHDYDRLFFERWGLERLRGLLEEDGLTFLDPSDLRLGPPVATPRMIVALGSNYAEHAKEFDGDLPDKPILFAKAPSAWNGPKDPVQIPDRDAPVDAEAELAIVIGKTAKKVTEENAQAHIAGYMALNDVTDRRAQREVSQWFRGKGADGCCPAGPFLVTPDEISNPSNLRIRQVLNGEILQDGSTADMIFPPDELIAYISNRTTLQPGDVITTGTPSGIGSARTPPVTLKPGDVVEITIDGLGTQITKIV
jgi:2-keto-4-pentenoate hydratase/2-oxohepta-3-ene-1,7-dioic acid hydratase in catechol pathway